MLIYVAGPIDQAGDDWELTRLREDVRLSLASFGAATYDPSRPYCNPKADSAAVSFINEAALARADGLLAILPKGVATIGTPMEIRTAVDLGKPVAVLTNAKSVQLDGLSEGDQLALLGLGDAGRAVRWVLNRKPAQAPEPQIQWTGDPEYEPQRKYPGDAGFDLVCEATMVIRPGEFVDVPCGIKMELPEGTWAMVTGRSSTLRKKSLFVPPGIVDNGYRGHVFAGVWNLGDQQRIVERGERIAQVIPFPLEAARMVLGRVETLSPSDRGEDGFGSTGD